MVYRYTVKHNNYVLGSYLMSYCTVCVAINASTSKYMVVSDCYLMCQRERLQLLPDIQHLDAPMILG